MRIARLIIAAWLVSGGPLFAQTLPIDPGASQTEVQSQDEGLRDTARTANTGAGEVGQRQTSSEAAPNIEPIARLSNRIENRVENRLRNRIDRNYDATANATSPYKRAESNARDRGRREPRR